MFGRDHRYAARPILDAIYIVPQNNGSNQALNIKVAIHKASAGVSGDILDTLPIC